MPAILQRNGKDTLPTLDTTVETGDILQLSATTEGANALRASIHSDEKGQE
jgi:hypothetical protein